MHPAGSQNNSNLAWPNVIRAVWEPQASMQLLTFSNNS